MIITSEDAREKKTLAKELIELVGPKAKFVELPPEASEERFLKLEVRGNIFCMWLCVYIYPDINFLKCIL